MLARLLTDLARDLRRRAARARDDERGLLRVRRLAVVVLLIGMAACVGRSGDNPADPVVLPALTTPTAGDAPAIPEPDPALVPTSAAPTPGRSPIPGFGEVAIQVEGPTGLLEWCLLLAESTEQRNRGLMEITDPSLGGYDGMVFRYPEETGSSAFYMRNTPMPLSLAYVAGAGTVVTVLQMAPCPDQPNCPLYPPTAPFRWAVEVPVAVGGVEHLGLVEGAMFIDTGRTCSA